MALSANELHLVSANKKYASTFDQGSLTSAPLKKYIVVTCMDVRVDPASAFGIKLGDANVLRNAGGSVEDALSSIIISQQLLGTVEVLVIKHTDCGMMARDREVPIERIETQLGPEAEAELKDRRIHFRFFPDLENAVKNDVRFLENTNLVPDDVIVSGWIYDVHTGKVRKVV